MRKGICGYSKALPRRFVARDSPSSRRPRVFAPPALALEPEPEPTQRLRTSYVPTHQSGRSQAPTQTASQTNPIIKFGTSFDFAPLPLASPFPRLRNLVQVPRPSSLILRSQFRVLSNRGPSPFASSSSNRNLHHGATRNAHTCLGPHLGRRVIA